MKFSIVLRHDVLKMTDDIAFHVEFYQTQRNFHRIIYGRKMFSAPPTK